MKLQVQLDSEARLCNLGMIYLSLWRYARELCQKNLAEEALHPDRRN